MSNPVYITGIAGFIGCHLALALKNEGWEVIGCDNFNDYYDVALKNYRENKLKNAGIDVIHADICSLETLSGAPYLIHLAAQAGVRYSLKHPKKYIASNLDGFVNILEICRRENVKKILFASSSSVYGLTKKVPFKESDPTDKPISLYGATKKSNELLAYSYHHLFKIPMIGLRFFTVYGPMGRPDMAYYSFSEKIRQGKPIEIFNHGDMLRDFTYIDDIVAGIVSALNYNASYEIFNLGNSHPERLDQLISYLENGLQKKAQRISLPMQPGDVQCTYANIEKSQKKLNFSPKISLEKGIEKFIDWYLDYSRLNRL
ncbi:MAG: NAD-dependent epimerase/dehydratase family protein [Simkaniaceae bacterium]